MVSQVVALALVSPAFLLGPNAAQAKMVEGPGEATVDRALEASAAGRHEDAIAFVDGAIATAPNDPVLHLRRSGILETAGDARAAAAQAAKNAGELHAAASNFDDASASAQRYLALAPAEAPNRARVEARVEALRARAERARSEAAALARPIVPNPLPPPAVDAQPTQSSLREIDAARDRRELNRQRRVSGAVVLGFGLAGAGVGIGLVAGSLRLNYPASCSDGDDTTLCEDVGVRTSRVRLGAGAATGLAAAVMMGVGTAILARTPSGADTQLSRRRARATIAAGVPALAVGLGLLATAGVLGARAARDFDSADTTDETQMRGAIATANATVALGVAGVIVAATGAGLLAVPRPRRTTVALRSAIGPRHFGITLTGRLPW